MTRATPSPSVSAGRFIGAGLLAGLLSLVSGIAAAYVLLGDYMDTVAENIGGFPTWTPIVHTVLRFGFGFGAVWVAWASLTRTGDRWRAVAIATLVCWILAYPVPLELWHFLGVPIGPLMLAAVWGVAETAVAIMVGLQILTS